MRILEEALTFDDVLLVPAYSEILPREVDLSTRLTRRIRLNVPLVSAAMDTVTEARLAITIAQEGGIGIIHKNMSIPQQTREVDKVKRSENGIITDPITLPPDQTVGTARRIMEQQNISGVPITVDGYLKGIRATGCQADESDIRLGFATAAGLRAFSVLRLDLTDEEQLMSAAAFVRFLLDLGDEARLTSL